MLLSKTKILSVLDQMKAKLSTTNNLNAGAVWGLWRREVQDEGQISVAGGWLCDWFERSGIGEINISLFFSLVALIDCEG